MPELKARYSELAQQNYLPLHLQPWWLDAVCGAQNWDLAMNLDANGRILGVLPYFRTRRWGLPCILSAPFTTYAGPWLFHPDPQQKKDNTRHTYEKTVLQNLIRQLPKTFYFRQNLRPEIQNWLPFYWAGFQQTTRYTYRIEPSTYFQTHFEGNLRRHLQKAEKNLHIRQNTDDYQVVFDLNQQSFVRKNKAQPYSIQTFQALHEALQERGQCAVWTAAKSLDAAPSAGLYLAFDAKEAAILITGMSPSQKQDNGMSLLFLQAIQFCAERGLRLDFEGSMDAGIERFFRGFGGDLVAYHQVFRWFSWGG